MSANLTYKYRIYPNKTQTAQLDRIFSIAWRVYNDIRNTAELAHRRGEKFNAYGIRDLFCAQRHDIECLQLLPADTIDDLVRRYQKALKAFWKRGNSGYPKEKRRRDFSGVGYRYASGIKFISEREKVARIRLFAVDGLIRVQYHRPLPEGWVIKHVVITLDGGQWHASLMLEGEPLEVPRSTNPPVGIDMGLVHLIALSDGTVIDHPHWFTVTQNKRTGYAHRLDYQRRVNNPQNYNDNGTAKEGVFIWRKSNRMRAVMVLDRKLARKVKNQRWYFWHVTTDWLTKTYGSIALEDLNLDFMIKNGKLAKHVHDAGLGMFREMLEDKAARRGVLITYVDPAYTSQTCHECGCVDAANRPERHIFKCVACGYENHADINAAKNILKRADFGAVQTPSDIKKTDEVKSVA